MDSKPSFLWIIADNFSEFNSSYFTCVIPHNALWQAGYRSKIIHMKNWLENNALFRSSVASADVVIIQRVLIKQTENMLLFLREQGKTVLVSFDDAYHLIGEENAAYSFWGKGLVDVNHGHIVEKSKMDTHPVDQFRSLLPKISSGICPSRVLAKDWAPHGAMTYLPNYLESHRYLMKNRRRISNKRVVGWGGSLSHLTSFSGSGAQEGLREFIAENSDDAVFELVGDKRLIDQLKIASDNLKFRPYVMFFDWPRVLSSFDIGLAPLAQPYDQRRSRLKVMEYIAMGIPFVATKSAVYEDFFDCKSGIFVSQGNQEICGEKNEDGWLKALTEMSKNYDKYKRQAVNERSRYFSVYDSRENLSTIVETLTLDNVHEIRRSLYGI